MDLESVAEELYAGSPDDFVERRSQRVAEARAARERPLAKAISQLRRPSRSAWMVNLLSRQAADDVRALLELGAALAQAQQRAASEDLRRLSSQRHLALDALTRRATELAAAAGHAATEASRQEVTSTLQAALADSAVADLVRAGRVTAPVTYAGFGPLELFAPAPAAPAEGAGVQPGPQPQSEPESEPGTAAEPAADPEPESPEPAGEATAPDPGRRAAEETVRQAADLLEAAESEAMQASRDAEDATRHADELADAVEALREQLQQAEDEERRAGDLARAARRRAAQHQRAVTEARQVLAEAQDALEQLT